VSDSAPKTLESGRQRFPANACGIRDASARLPGSGRLGAGQGGGDNDYGDGGQYRQHNVCPPFRALAVRIDVNVRHGGRYSSLPEEALAFRIVCRRRTVWAQTTTTSDTAMKMARAVT